MGPRLCSRSDGRPVEALSSRIPPTGAPVQRGVRTGSPTHARRGSGPISYGRPAEPWAGRAEGSAASGAGRRADRRPAPRRAEESQNGGMSRGTGVSPQGQRDRSRANAGPKVSAKAREAAQLRGGEPTGRERGAIPGANLTRASSDAARSVATRPRAASGAAVSTFVDDRQARPRSMGRGRGLLPTPRASRSHSGEWG